MVIATMPSGHREPQPPVGVKESRDLRDCHEELVRRYEAFEADFKSRTGRELYPTCTWRSKDRQLELWLEGRAFENATQQWVVVDKKKIKTKLDGHHKKSRHNVYPAEAVDVAIDNDPGPGKHLNWDPAAYEVFAELALKHGLIWGGDWNKNGTSRDESFVDFPHLELPADAA